MTTMPFEQLEQAYECLAEAIDRTGPASEAVFFTKLVLTLAHQLGDIDLFKDAVAIALQDLPEGAPTTSGASPAVS